MNIVACISRAASASRMSSVTPVLVGRSGCSTSIVSATRSTASALDASDHDAAREHALEKDVDHDRDDERHQRPCLEERWLTAVDAVEALQANGQRLELGLRGQ